MTIWDPGIIEQAALSDILAALAPDGTSNFVLVISDGTHFEVPPGEWVQCTCRARINYATDGAHVLVLADAAPHFQITEFQIGHFSQLDSAEPVPAAEASRIQLKEAIFRDQDISITAVNISSEPRTLSALLWGLTPIGEGDVARHQQLAQESHRPMVTDVRDL